LEVVAGRPERSPEYSLGSYVRTAVVRERGDLYNQSARIVKVSALHFFYHPDAFVFFSLSDLS
jgi:hypothetical protein